jgi:hypothetical protein
MIIFSDHVSYYLEYSVMVYIHLVSELDKMTLIYNVGNQNEGPGESGDRRGSGGRD